VAARVELLDENADNHFGASTELNIMLLGEGRLNVLR